ncbi:hypothetical protein SAMN05421784_1112 [Xenorhabdus koppenhoeferi]|uniref:Uncharacterized protein n=1 Tax=Xenorhabdus koppenhoeferi TaxID=351659 RepID=A0A1I7H215_9GAMM|nr:hypothetical protein SAMN05421784_1112 [Xenorhabdus koppenhoeferi]
MKINLTNDQKKALELMHDTTRDGRVRDRIKAVLLASEATCMFGLLLKSLRSVVPGWLDDRSNFGHEPVRQILQQPFILSISNSISGTCCTGSPH